MCNGKLQKTKLKFKKIKQYTLNMLSVKHQKRIAIAGCFRSGTNYTKTLLETNFHCQVKNDLFGWKHGFIPIITKGSSLDHTVSFDAGVFVTKNPFSFLVSLFNYFESVDKNIQAEKEFSQFIASKIIIRDSGQINSPSLRFSSPIELWNMMNWNYLSSPNFTHISYEALLENPETYINQIAKQINIVKKKGPLKFPTKQVKRMKDNHKFVILEEYESTQSFNKSSYQDHQYMNRYTLSDIELILERLDDELVQQLGYTDLINFLVKK
ncbi:hypothetical protein ACR30L_03510 [Psychromonas sp. PT13]|uniref:hypothetical protein n=1 Tax=Psychromonas sp. PT13 TaxID=3439547 RepID=UPI003EB786B0